MIAYAVYFAKLADATSHGDNSEGPMMEPEDRP